MTFATAERSNEGGRPYFLYEFHLGTQVWRFTSTPPNRVVGGFTYYYAAISDDGIKQTGDATADVLSITVPSSIGPASMFIGSPPAHTMYVLIRHMHEGEGDAPLVYQGEIIQANFNRPGQVVLQALPMSALMAREGLRLGWQRTCPYALYDPHTCKVDKSEHEVDTHVASVSNGLVTLLNLNGAPDGYFDGGFMVWEHPTRGTEMRSIELQVGLVLKMFGFTDGIFEGMSVKVYPGCNLTTDHCKNKFNNLVNYGGCPHMPGRSPYDGQPLY